MCVNKIKFPSQYFALKTVVPAYFLEMVQLTVVRERMVRENAVCLLSFKEDTSGKPQRGLSPAEFARLQIIVSVYQIFCLYCLFCNIHIILSFICEYITPSECSYCVVSPEWLS